jgi:cellulose synthase/poly-beta-1,6-N-acetylglucosamine synthase-like glycosyltransferase
LTLLITLICLFFALFSVLIFFLILGWNRIPIFIINNLKSSIYVSVIVVVRNEIRNIDKLIQSIDKQLYNNNLFELIVVDDFSNDGTLELLEKLKNNVNFDLKIVNYVANDFTVLGKKAAITKAITLAKGELILTTDGDCTVGPNWIASFVNFYQKSGKKLVSGPVVFNSNSFFGHLQTVEFASLIATGAASIWLKRPNMCNGANLCYEKSAFLAVNGFDGFEDIPSGDDEFLMHKINAQFHDSIGFIKSFDTLVTTLPQPDLNSFLSQRKRWASKWDKYLALRNTILAIFVFGVNLCAIMALGLMFLGKSSIVLNIIFLIKIILEWFFISQFLLFANLKRMIIFIPIVQVFYPFYVIFIGLSSYSKTYVWKGRTY